MTACELDLFLPRILHGVANSSTSAQWDLRRPPTDRELESERSACKKCVHCENDRDVLSARAIYLPTSVLTVRLYYTAQPDSHIKAQNTARVIF